MTKTKNRILVVDDDKNLLDLISMRLNSSGFDVSTAIDEDIAIEKMKDETFDLCIIDLQLARTDGISLMQKLHNINPAAQAMILTAHGSIESAVEAMRKGAYNYLTKPFDPRELVLQVQRALEIKKLSTEVKRLKGLLCDKYDFKNIITRNPAMQRILEQVRNIAATDSTVYIHGESGTGKELIVRAIHMVSERCEQPFTAINCAALPETLLESELFGYLKGAFTGAIKNKKGLLTRTNHGTLLLDEIGEMPVPIQAKFLRVMEEQKFYPLGSEEPVNIDVRFIVATNKDLIEEVRQGRFREDLFYRIHVIPIKLPPLRERKEDIPLLTSVFIGKFSKKMGKKIRGLTPAALQRLLRYDWPGNIRELKNTIEYAVAMTSEDMIREELVLSAKGPPEKPQPLKAAKEEFEKKYLTDILKLNQGNVSHAASQAGKYRADFYNLMKKHGIDPAEFKHQNAVDKSEAPHDKKFA